MSIVTPTHTRIPDGHWYKLSAERSALHGVAALESIRDTVREFILNEFLPGESSGNLADDTPLIASGILDSLGTLKLVAFLEETYRIRVKPHETDQDYLGSVASVIALVESKL